MKALNSFLLKLKLEPPFAAAVLTVFIFTVPVLVSIINRGIILLPAGYTSSLIVEPVYGLFALLINIALLWLFGMAPVFKAGFQSIVTPDIVRKVMIYGYIAVTFISFYIINAKLNFISSLIEDPVLTILRVGGKLGEENLLRYYFYGISGCIGFSLVSRQDGFFLRSVSFICMISIVLFYFFLGRREISIMTLCFLFLLKSQKVSRTQLIIIGAFVTAIIVFVLSLRAGDDNGSMFSTNSEELSSVAYSCYVIQKTTPNITGSLAGATLLRAYLNPLGISEEFIRSDSGYNEPGSPVLGIAGITYMYGFIIPFISVIVFGSFFRTVSREFQKKKSPVIKLLLIYVVFRSFNLFRNGEFPVVTLDMIKFFVLISPAIFLKFTPGGTGKIELDGANT
jgi:hypothetical protein